MELIGLLLLTFIFNKKIDCSNIPTESVENYTFLYQKDELKTDYSNFVVEEDPEGLGSAKNPIKLNNGLNVDVYCILINDTIVFNLNGFSTNGYKPFKFKITIGAVDTVFTLRKSDEESMDLSIYINGKKAITTDNFMMNDSLTVTINKNGNITGEKLLPIKDTDPSLGTLPTINGDNVVHMKINGSELSNATMNLTFQTKVGKLVDNKTSVANSSSTKIIVGIVCGIAVVIAIAVIVTCCLWPICPIYQKFRNKHNKNDKIVAPELKTFLTDSQRCVTGNIDDFYNIYNFNYDNKDIPLDPARIECFKSIELMRERKKELLDELDKLKKRHKNRKGSTVMTTETSLKKNELEQKRITLEKEMTSVLFKDWVRKPDYPIAAINLQKTENKIKSGTGNIVNEKFHNAFYLKYDNEDIPLNPARIECFKIIDSMHQKYQKLNGELDELTKKGENCKDVAEKNQISKQINEEDEKLKTLFKEINSLLFEDWLKNPDYSLDFGILITTKTNLFEDKGIQHKATTQT